MKITLALLLAVSALPIQAQESHGPWMIGVKAGTLGIGPEAGYTYHRLGVRVSGNWAKVDHDVTISNILYSGSLQWRSAQGLIDLHLFGPIRISGGAVYNANRLDVTAEPGTVTIIGSTAYSASNIQSLTGTIAFPKFAPYGGLGYVTGGRVGLAVDVGVLYQGRPTVTLSGTSTLSGPADDRFKAEVQAEQTKMEQDLDGEPLVKVWPVVALGLHVNF